MMTMIQKMMIQEEKINNYETLTRIFSKRISQGNNSYA